MSEQLLTFTAPVELTAAETDKPAKASIVAYTGGIMTVPGFGPLVIDLDGLKLAESVTLLSDHDSSRRGVVGSAKAQIVGGRVELAGTISRQSEAGREIIGLAADDVQWQASVGVRILKYERLRAGEAVRINGRSLTAPPEGLLIVRGGLLRETTICALGCDERSSVIIQAWKGFQHMFGIGKSGKETLDTPEGGDQPDLIAQERERVKKIESVCKGDFGTLQARVDDLKAQAIDGDMDIETLQAGVLQCLRASRPQAPKIGSHFGVSFDPNGQHIEAAVMLASGMDEQAVKVFGENCVQQSRDMRLRTFQDIARCALMLEGRDVPRDATDFIRAASSTHSLPVALGAGVEKMVGVMFTESNANTWRSFCAIRSVENFHDHSTVSPEHRGQLQKIGGDGEIKHGTITEDVITGLRVDTFAEIISLNRQTLKNDSLGVLMDMTRPMAQKAVRKLADLVYETLMANAGSFFDAGNNNLLTGGGSPLSITSLTTLVQQMRKQRDVDNNDLSIVPRTLTVPPELEIPGRSILNSIELNKTGDNSPTGNALKNIANLEVEPRLSNTAKFTGASLTAWYLFADIMSAAMYVCFLDGKQTPTVEQEPQSFEYLGMRWRVFHDFGAALGEFRAAQKSAGA